MARAAAAAEKSSLGQLHQRTQNVEACGVCLVSRHSRALQSNSGAGRATLLLNYPRSTQLSSLWYQP